MSTGFVTLLACNLIYSTIMKRVLVGFLVHMSSLVQSELPVFRSSFNFPSLVFFCFPLLLFLEPQMPDASVSVPEISGSLPEVSGDVSVPSVGGGVDVDVAVPPVEVDASAPSAPSINLPGEYAYGKLREL